MYYTIFVEFQSFFLWKLVMKGINGIDRVYTRRVSILLPLETGHEAASPFNPLKINKLYPYLSIIKSFLQHVKEHSFTHFSFVFRNLKYLFISILQSK